MIPMWKVRELADKVSVELCCVH